MCDFLLLILSERRCLKRDGLYLGVVCLDLVARLGSWVRWCFSHGGPGLRPGRPIWKAVFRGFLGRLGCWECVFRTPLTGLFLLVKFQWNWAWFYHVSEKWFSGFSKVIFCPVKTWTNAATNSENSVEKQLSWGVCIWLKVCLTSVAHDLAERCV